MWRAITGNCCAGLWQQRIPMVRSAWIAWAWKKPPSSWTGSSIRVFKLNQRFNRCICIQIFPHLLITLNEHPHIRCQECTETICQGHCGAFYYKCWEHIALIIRIIILHKVVERRLRVSRWRIGWVKRFGMLLRTTQWLMMSWKPEMVCPQQTITSSCVVGLKFHY